jgi:potassium-dependent mechanosensitive channel
MHRFVDICRGFAFFFAVLVAWSLATPPVSAQTKAPAEFETAKSTLDRIERVVQQEGLSNDILAALKQQLTPVRDDLRVKIESLEPQLAQTDNRLRELGSPPAAGAAPEDSSLTGERKRLTAARAETEAALKQARLLVVRVDQVSERINERRRTIFTRELFVRGPGLFDIAFWRSTVEAAADEARSIADLVGEWWDFVGANGGRVGVAAALVTFALIIAGALALRHWWRRRFAEDIVDSRFGRSLAALIVLAGHAVVPAVAVAGAVSLLDSHGLMPPRVADLGFGLGVAVAIAGFGRGVAFGLFAPGQSGRRLLACSEAEAGVLVAHLVWGARLLAFVVFLNLVHKGFSAPISLTVATSALLAVGLGLLSLHLLIRVPRDAGDGGTWAVRLAWLRMLIWVVIVAMSASLVTGYIGFAAFLAGRLLVVLAMLGSLYIAIAFVDALFCEVLTGDTAIGRSLANMLGVSTRALELVGTLLSALCRIALVLLAISPVLGQWGIFAADVFGVLQDAAYGIRIGDITISITGILAAVAIFLIGILATRGAQRWLERRFLPRTGLEQSLQHSVSALFGYALLIAVISLTLAHIGLDLQKIAFVAGALSFGIGFGLQSIVANFISGLILLAERPIRVGDWVVVKAEEGWVRRISVRATEIETFDRATVIVPNSEFITGIVKNWTHSNTMGRITVKVGAAYDSDVERVRDLLLDCAREHPQVLQTPPPRVFLLGFGDNALDFELRCIVANVENSLTVKSDLHFDVLARFRAAGIVIPCPQREVRLLGREDGPAKESRMGSPRE